MDRLIKRGGIKALPLAASALQAVVVTNGFYLWEPPFCLLRRGTAPLKLELKTNFRGAVPVGWFSLCLKNVH